MARQWRRWIGTIAIATAVIVAALALLWAVWWLWSLLSPQWDSRTILAIAIAALVPLAAIWWLWWRLPGRQVARLSIQIPDPKARADAEDNFRKTVGQALGGAAVLIGAAAAYLQFTQQQQASHDLLISNQVSKGFEQLAGTETAMRLGGIYALEGVMNAPSSQYRVPVLEALCAFVRDSTTRHQVTLTTFLAALFPAAHDKTAGNGNDAPATDVQAALTVIGRRNPGLGSVNLAGANIPRANLFGANIPGANLIGAHLEGASLIGAHLEGANLIGAHLERAFLSQAHLEVASLSQAHLEGANLIAAHLQRAFLGQAHLERAFLPDAHLEGAILWRAHLERADLRGADGLTQAQIEDAYGDAATELPEGLTRPARWTAATGGGAAPAR